MAGFTDLQWQKINHTLGQNPRRFGLPIRRSGSVVIGSFNALKLGKDTDKAKNWDFLKRFVSRFDLLALQEVMDDLSGIRRLHDSLGSGYKLVVSDTTGAFPGSRGLRERLAFFYRPSRIELKELVSDISYDRSIVIHSLKQGIDTWNTFFTDLDNDNIIRKQQGKKPRTLSDVAHPAFLTFIRTPHCASFSIRGKNGSGPIEFLAVNAHTLYGKSKDERTREFFALMDWVIHRAKAAKRMYFKNIILLADLNMNFDSPSVRLSNIILKLHQLNSTLLTGQNAARVNFPFLDVHPTQTALFNTNARKDETFDHIAFFIDKKEKKLPKTDANREAGQNGPNGYDFGVFDFIELFADALHGTPFANLSAAKKKDLLRRANADVSDHMPIWARIPIPGA